MKRRRLLASLFLAVSLGVAAPLVSAAAPVAAAVPAIDAFAITGTGTGLVTFSTSAPAAFSAPRTIAGLQPGEIVLGIDVRPTTGQLFALGSTSRLYVLDPFTAAASVVGPGAPFSPALSGTSFGFDFNPVADRIRVTSNTGQNLRLNPSTGAVAGNDTALNGATPAAIEGAAYTNSAGVATTTTLYGINATTATLYIQNPPNNGTLVPVGPLGLAGIAPQVGFDILVSGSAHKAVASLTVFGIPNLYEINLTTGAATPLGFAGQTINALALAGPGGYCGADFDAEVACVGGAGGAQPAIPNLVEDIVDAVQTPSGQGVWQVAFDGGVFGSGDAEFFGSVGGIPLNDFVVGMAPHPSGRGYWLVAADGGVFAFGEAGFFGSVPGVLAPGQVLNAAVVGIVGTGTGRGYWMVAEDGGIFAFGDAEFFGSVPGALAPGQSLVQPVIGVARNEIGPGYYMVALDGGVFAFGAPFLGSAGGLPLVAPITDIASAGPTGGYRIFAADGGIFTYGGASFSGSIPGMTFGVGLAG